MTDVPRSTSAYQPKVATVVLADTELAWLIEDIRDAFPG